MTKIVHYIGLDVHKETIAVSIAPQNSPEVRRLACEGLGFLGIALDDRRNVDCEPLISTDASPTRHSGCFGRRTNARPNAARAPGRSPSSSSVWPRRCWMPGASGRAAAASRMSGAASEERPDSLSATAR